MKIDMHSFNQEYKNDEDTKRTLEISISIKHHPERGE